MAIKHTVAILSLNWTSLMNQLVSDIEYKSPKILYPIVMSQVYGTNVGTGEMRAQAEATQVATFNGIVFPQVTFFSFSNTTTKNSNI